MVWLPGHLRERRIVSPVQSFVSVEPIENLNAWESRCLTVFQIRVEPSIVSAEHPGLWSGFRPRSAAINTEVVMEVARAACAFCASA
jgi:hypothetical protein